MVWRRFILSYAWNAFNARKTIHIAPSIHENRDPSIPVCPIRDRNWRHSADRLVGVRLRNVVWVGEKESRALFIWGAPYIHRAVSAVTCSSQSTCPGVTATFTLAAGRGTRLIRPRLSRPPKPNGTDLCATGCHLHYGCADIVNCPVFIDLPQVQP